MRQWRTAMAVITTLVLVGTACTGGPGTTGGGATSQPEEKPVPGGRVIEGRASDAQRLNPAVSNDDGSSLINSKIYDTLVSTNTKTGEAIPWMGKWTVTADNLLYTWTIDPKANWSDGKPLIAEDWLTRVKAQARSKITPNKSVYNDIEGYQDYSSGKATSIPGITINSADPKKFTVKFTRPFCPALLSVFGTAPLPTHIFGKYTVDNDPSKNLDEAPENTAPPVASGPFKFKEWRKGDQVTLVRNETYWNGAPLLDEYVLKVVADTTVVAAQLKTGELTVGIVAPADVADLERQDNLKVYKWQDPGYTYIGWKNNHPNVPALADKRIRQALAYGLDMSAVLKAVFFGEGVQMYSHHAPVSWAAATGLNEYKYDKAKADQLIQSAGYTKGSDGFYQKDGKTLGWSIVTNQGNKTRETMLQVVTEQYKQLGVKINPKIEAFESLVPKLTSGSTEIETVIIGWQIGAEADAYTIWHSSSIPTPQKGGNNFVGFSNSRVDQLLDTGRGPDCSQATRKKAYQEMNQILNEEQPYNFGISGNRLLATSKAIRGIEPGSFSPTGEWNIEKWWIKK
jgi:peptide/nickel transport system substrate-binding protein